MKVLFVCTGNSCRSVMAQYLFNRMVRERGLPWEARSAGTAAERHFGVPPGARKALAERGVEQVDHVPRLATREALRWADLVLTMAKVHRDHLRDEFPEFHGKIRLFSEYAGLGDADVADPIGQPDAIYARCRDLIEKGLENVFRAGVQEKP